MASYTESRKRKEAFRKARAALLKKAEYINKHHQGEVYMLLIRNGRWYPIKACSGEVSEHTPNIPGGRCPAACASTSTFTLIKPAALRPSQKNAWAYGERRQDKSPEDERWTEQLYTYAIQT